MKIAIFNDLNKVTQITDVLQENSVNKFVVISEQLAQQYMKSIYTNELLTKIAKTTKTEQKKQEQVVLDINILKEDFKILFYELIDLYNNIFLLDKKINPKSFYLEEKNILNQENRQRLFQDTINDDVKKEINVLFNLFVSLLIDTGTHIENITTIEDYCGTINRFINFDEIVNLIKGS